MIDDNTTPLKGRIWFRLEAGYEDDISFWCLSPYAELMFVRGLSWVKRNDTDGLIPDKALTRLGMRISADLPSLAMELVTAGRWLLTEEGWEVSLYGKWQETIEARAEKEESRRQGGFAKAHKAGFHNKTPSDGCLLCSSRASAELEQSLSTASAEPSSCEALLNPALETETETETESESEKPSSSSKSYSRVDAPLDPKKMGEEILQEMGYAKPGPTRGEVNAVTRAIGKDWQAVQLHAWVKRRAADATHNPRKYVFDGLANIGTPPHIHRDFEAELQAIEDAS